MTISLKYDYRILWRPGVDENPPNYKATVTEFPALTAKSYDVGLSLSTAISKVADEIAGLASRGEAVPPPQGHPL